MIVERGRFTVHDLKSSDALLRRRALGNLVREAEGAAPSASLLRACVARLADKERAVRRFSAQTLERWLGQGDPRTAGEVRRRLRGALDHRSSHVAWGAAHILAQVDGPRPRLVRPLLRAFTLDDEEARWAAAQSLTKLAHGHPRLAGRLRRLSRRGSPVERRMALYCLRDLPRSVSNGADPFLRALGDPDPIVRSTAVSSLGRLGQHTPPVLDGLLVVLRQDPSILARRVAAVALGQISAGRRDVRDSLEAAMEAEDPDLRRAARHAVARLTPVTQRGRRTSSRSSATASGRRKTKTKK